MDGVVGPPLTPSRPCQPEQASDSIWALAASLLESCSILGILELDRLDAPDSKASMTILDRANLLNDVLGMFPPDGATMAFSLGGTSPAILLLFTSLLPY